MDKKGLIGEHLGFEVSTSFFNAPEENVDQAIRALDELSSTESMTFTTESSLPDFSFTTAEPMTFTTESSLPDFSFTTVEPTTYTSESSFADKRIHHDFSFTTIEPTESLPQLEIRSFTNESENENESETDKREIQVDFTTSDMVYKYIFKLINKTYFFIVLVIIYINSIKYCSRIVYITIINFNIIINFSIDISFNININFNINRKIYWSS